MALAINPEHQQMLREIEDDIRMTASVTGIRQFSHRVMNAMKTVPREKFVPDDLQHMAFYNAPLPIGYGQTISQPYIVALMTELLQLQPDHTILEIGTGSGYQAAVLAQLCKQVYTLERIEQLAAESSRRFSALNYQNITSLTGNGYQGLPEHAPYDGIIVTAAATEIPNALIDQLKPGARLVIPVGHAMAHQELLMLEKNDDNSIKRSNVLGVAFVPLVKEDKP